MGFVAYEYRRPGNRFEVPPTYRSVGIGYGLWALGLLGVAGVHRFYAGKYLTGLLWLLTFGLLGFGQIIDLFLIPGMIDRQNRRLARHGSFEFA